MARKPANHGTTWTKPQVEKLKKLVKQNTPTRVIGIKLGRTEDCIYSEASKEKIWLKPTNQSPFNRRKR